MLIVSRHLTLTSLVAQSVKRLPMMQETWVQSLGQEDLLEKEMATHSSILAWKIPWTEDPGRLQSMGSQRVEHDWVTSLHPKETHKERGSVLGWMASLMQRTWVRVGFGSWWWTGKPGVLQSTGSQRVGKWLNDWTEVLALLFPKRPPRARERGWTNCPCTKAHCIRRAV